MREHILKPGLLNDFRCKSCRIDDTCGYDLIREFLRQHELLLQYLIRKEVHMSVNLEQKSIIDCSLRLGLIDSEHNSMEEMLLDKVKWSHSVQVPAQRIKKI